MIVPDLTYIYLAYNLLQTWLCDLRSRVKVSSNAKNVRNLDYHVIRRNLLLMTVVQHQVTVNKVQYIAEFYFSAKPVAQRYKLRFEESRQTTRCHVQGSAEDQ